MAIVYLYEENSLAGHVAIKISSTYISWQGDGKVYDKIIFHDEIKTAESTLNTFERDREVYDGKNFPPRQIIINGLSEHEMARWWRLFTAGRPLYDTLKCNCASVTASLLHEGVGRLGWGENHWPQMLWTPSSLWLYAKDVRHHRMPHNFLRTGADQS